VLFAAGGALRIWPVFVLGERFSGLVAIQPGHTLVTSGVYGVIRHPSYLGLFINSLGWSLAFRSGVGVILTMLLIAPLLARISAEENLLHDQFGAEYNVYCSHTWRLIPGIYMIQLTNNQIQEIAASGAIMESNREMAERFGVGIGLVARIRNGKPYSTSPKRAWWDMHAVTIRRTKALSATEEGESPCVGVGASSRTSLPTWAKNLAMATSTTSTGSTTTVTTPLTTVSGLSTACT